MVESYSGMFSPDFRLITGWGQMTDGIKQTCFFFFRSSVTYGLNKEHFM